MGWGDKRILVAEDNEALASVLRFNLERQGFQVVTASNGREAWELAQQEQFHLLITDQNMPEMTGLQLCQQVRSLERYGTTPIILITAHFAELPRYSESLRIATTFRKPFSLRQITKAIEDCLAAAQ